MINQVRQDKGLHLIQTEDGWTPRGHPNASYLRISTEKHGLGSMSMDHLETLDLSAATDPPEIPILEKSHSRIGDIRKVDTHYQLPLFLDKSGRKHTT